MNRDGWAEPWPFTTQDLVDQQLRLAQASAAARSAHPWRAPAAPLAAGCFVAFERRERSGGPATRAWAAAVAWRTAPQPHAPRKPDALLRGRPQEEAPRGRSPRQASDVDAQVVIADEVRAPYSPGLLALREGPILTAAVGLLPVAADVLLVNATGFDHPRRAGLAAHLGAVCDLPSVGVTHRPLLAHGAFPRLVRGSSAPVSLDGEVVARWVCTRSGTRPVLAHAGWRTDPSVAAELVLLASTEAARTPVPLEEARRVAREARAIAGG